LSCPSSCALSRRSTWQSPSTCSWTTRCSCSENTVCFSRLTTGSPCAASNTCWGTVLQEILSTSGTLTLNISCCTGCRLR
jgi:hypothetical protein